MCRNDSQPQKNKSSMIDYGSLMIGDYVLDGNEIAQVTNIGCDGIISTTKYMTSNIMNISPIPLTTDILMKNDFEEIEKDEYNEYICEKCDGNDCYEIRVCWKDSYDNGAADAFNLVCWDEEWMLYIEGNKNSYSKVGCKTIYLHELQHAIKICGINKEIKL